ncbi:MAG TPA: hypothetical protein VJ715_09140 [Pyrinomonadaceae bacterium]|nr:hypothetical protein [Pyrinomonadaceae bacterium]
MTKKTPIKVIKRDERNRKESTVEQPQRKSAQETARDMVNTVTTWVNEFQQKRRTETTRTTRAIQSLFQDPAQPNEA